MAGSRHGNEELSAESGRFARGKSSTDPGGGDKTEPGA